MVKNPYPFKKLNNNSKIALNVMQANVHDLKGMIEIYEARRVLLIVNAEQEVDEVCRGERHKTIHLERLASFDREAKALIAKASKLQQVSMAVFGAGDDTNQARREAFKRIPVDDFSPLNDIKEGDQRIAAFNKMIDEELARCGNNCQHSVNDLTHPHFHSPYDYNQLIEGDKLKPRLIYETLDRLMYAILSPTEYKGLFFRKTDEKVKKWDKKWRQIRIEGRVGMLRVLQVLLPLMDLKSLRTGIYIKDKDVFFGKRKEDIAKEAGLSPSRVTTALRNLEITKILFKADPSRQPKDQDEKTGEWKGFAHIRKFTTNLFEYLGLGDKLAKTRDPAEQKRQYAKEMHERKEGLLSWQDEAFEKEIDQAEKTLMQAQIKEAAKDTSGVRKDAFIDAVKSKSDKPNGSLFQAILTSDT